MNYPTSLDAFTNPTTNDFLNSPNHVQQHSDINDAVEALEAKLGISASTPTSGKLLRGTGAGSSAWDKDAPTGTIVGTTDSQTLTNKTLTSPTINTAIINNPTLNTDTISEFTSAAGVTVDGLLIKDAALPAGSIQTSWLAAGAVTAPKIDFGGSGVGVWWEEIARTTSGVAGDTVTQSSIPNRKYLRIYFMALNTGALSLNFTFNNDTAANYAHRYLASGTLGSTVSTTSIGNIGGTHPIFGIVDVVNISSSVKVGRCSVVGGDTSAATAPANVEFFFKWVNTSAVISRFDLINTAAGDFAAGTQIIVLGHN